MAGEPVHHVFWALVGDHIASQDSKGVIGDFHSGNEIIEDDVDRVLEVAQAVAIPEQSTYFTHYPQRIYCR